MGRGNEESRTSSVGLVGDGDEIDLLEDFERLFEITFSNNEAEQILTLGEAHEIICSKLPDSQEIQVKCLTAMTYYRLNRALGAGGKMHPGSQITIPPDLTPKEFQKLLEDESKLDLEFLTHPSSWVEFLFYFQFLSWVAAPILFSGVLAAVSGILVFLIFHGLWRLADQHDKRVWAFDGTVADLAKQAAQNNFGKLVSQGGKWNKVEVWKSMAAIIEFHTGYPTEQMTPDMKFI